MKYVLCVDSINVKNGTQNIVRIKSDHYTKIALNS